MSLPADDDVGAEFSGRANKEMKFGEGGGGGLLLTPTGAPEPLPLFIGTTGEHIKGGKKTSLSGGTMLNHF